MADQAQESLEQKVDRLEKEVKKVYEMLNEATTQVNNRYGLFQKVESCEQQYESVNKRIAVIESKMTAKTGEIKSGDTVEILDGKNAGLTGKVVEVVRKKRGRKPKNGKALEPVKA